MRQKKNGISNQAKKAYESILYCATEYLGNRAGTGVNDHRAKKELPGMGMCRQGIRESGTTQGVPRALGKAWKVGEGEGASVLAVPFGDLGGRKFRGGGGVCTCFGVLRCGLCVWGGIPPRPKAAAVWVGVLYARLFPI